MIEALVVTLVAAAAAVTMHWPYSSNLSTAAPVDEAGDPLYFSWQLSWVGHILTTDPLRLWTTNAFLQEPGNLAFTDAVLGYAPLSLLVGSSGPGDALTTLNLAVLTATTMAFLGAYALARVLGARYPGALVAGAGFAFAPWRLEHFNHPNVLSTGAAALSIALLCHGHGWSLRHGWQPDRIRPGWLLAGWLAACWQLTFGFAVGVAFAYVLAVLMALWGIGWLVSGRPRLPGRLLAAEALGGAAFLALAAALVQPYLRAVNAHPEATDQRTAEWLDFFSPSWRGYLTGAQWSHWYSQPQAQWREHVGFLNESILLPGFVLIGLALIGLLLSIWPLRRRLVLFGVVLVVAVLSLGTNGPAGGSFTFLPLWHHLPGWESIRTPGRLVIWVTLGLCLLAAGGVSRLTELVSGLAATRSPADPDRAPGRPQHRPGGWARPAAGGLALLLALPAAAVAVEGAGATPRRQMAAPVDLSGFTSPVLVFPSRPWLDYEVMLWSTQGWPVLANGSSGFEPAWINQLREETAAFPDARSVAALRQHGIKTVVLVSDWTPPESLALAVPRPDLGITVSLEGPLIVYRIP